jgi:hypothetical protein
MRVRQMLRGLLLPLLLLLAQQGMLLHEVRHVAPAERQDDSVKKEAAGLCKLCLAQAQAEPAAQPGGATLHLLAGLSYGWACQTQASVCAAWPPTPHSRGPPAFV